MSSADEEKMRREIEMLRSFLEWGPTQTDLDKQAAHLMQRAQSEGEHARELAENVTKLDEMIDAYHKKREKHLAKLELLEEVVESSSDRLECTCELLDAYLEHLGELSSTHVEPLLMTCRAGAQLLDKAAQGEAGSGRVEKFETIVSQRSEMKVPASEQVVLLSTECNDCDVQFKSLAKALKDL